MRAPFAPPRLSVPRNVAADAHAIETSWEMDSPDARILPLRFGNSLCSEMPGVITQCAAVGLTVEPKVLALVRARVLWRFPYLERIRGVLDGAPRGPVGPPGPPGQ